jgi:hypothetical protein
LNAVALVAVAEAAVVAVAIALVPLAPTVVDRKEAAGVADWL